MKKQIGWLFLPAAALGICLVCFAKTAAIQKSATAFAPIVRRVEIKQIRSDSNFAGDKTYHIVVFVGYLGMKPMWWGQEDGIVFNEALTNTRGKNGPQILKPYFISPTGRKFVWSSFSEIPSLYDPARQEYYVDLIADADKTFPVPDSRLVGVIKMGDGSTTKVSAPMSEAFQHPPAPSVHCPALMDLSVTQDSRKQANFIRRK